MEQSMYICWVNKLLLFGCSLLGVTTMNHPIQIFDFLRLTQSSYLIIVWDQY